MTPPALAAAIAATGTGAAASGDIWGDGGASWSPAGQYANGPPARHPCRERILPTRRSVGGCLPCPAYQSNDAALANLTAVERSWKLDVRSAATFSECIHCLLRSGEPFMVGRPGMGAPEEVACRAMTGRTHAMENLTLFLAGQRRVLKQLNGILTRNDEDAMSYARCYAAAINVSDVIVRVGGGPYMPLRKPDHTCARTGTKHHQKADVLLAQSGHFPALVLGDRGLNPWFLAAYHMRKELLAGKEEANLLPRVFAWTRALQGKTVLVVHPFNESIAKQLSRGSRALWGSYAEHIMPSAIRFKIVAPPQNLARQTENADWRDALDTLIERVDAAGHFDLAMIACGGLGMLLGAHLLATNRSSLYHGGELQLWFGVYGRRWAAELAGNQALLNKSLLANWVRPSAAETPAGAHGVEKGTYWR